MEIECGTCRWFIEDEDGERCLLNLMPVMCCDTACEDYENRKYIECIDEDGKVCRTSVGDIIEIDGVGIVEVTAIRDDETLEVKKASFKQKAEYYLDAGRRVRCVSDDEVSDIMSFACWIDSYKP